MSGPAEKLAPLAGGYWDSEDVPAPEPDLPKKPGRKSMCTPEVRETILVLVAAGAFKTVAARAAGITTQTLYNWIERAQHPDCDPDVAEFVRDLNRTMAEVRAKAEATVLVTNPLAWLRSGPGRDFGERDPGWTDPTIKVEGEVNHNHGLRRPDLSKLSVEELQQLKGLLLRAQPPRLTPPSGSYSDGGQEDVIDVG